jgi:plasmid stabilization system protein ParE
LERERAEAIAGHLINETNLANATRYVAEIRDLCAALASLREDRVRFHNERDAIRKRLRILLGIE